MARGKSHPKHGNSVKPWLSARPDHKEGRFIQVGNSLLFSKAFQDLSAGARFLYLCMAMEAGKVSNVLFPRGAGKKYGISATSFDRQIRELQEKGFLTRIESPSLGRCDPGRYKFIQDWQDILIPPKRGDQTPKLPPNWGE